MKITIEHNSATEPQPSIVFIDTKPVDPPDPIDPLPPPTGQMVPLLGTNEGHQFQNWMADFADTSKIVPRALPWTLPAYVKPMGGVTPARVRMWHTFGTEMGLYSSQPYFGTDGLSAPWSPQFGAGDNFMGIVKDLQKHPLKDGPRGIAVVTPYGTAVPHPFMMPDGITPIPRAPTWLWLQHDGIMQLLYADTGFVFTAGRIPTVQYAHDFCVDELNRRFMYVCELGTPDANGKFTGGSVKKVDRAMGMALPTRQEDASKYVVTTFLPGLIYPTGICTDEQGNVYTADYGTGKIYKNTTVWQTIDGAFMLRYDRGKVYVLTGFVGLFAIDVATGAIGPNLSASITGPIKSPISSNFFTLSIDRNGTFDLVGNMAITSSTSGGNIDVWIYNATTGVVKTAMKTYGSGAGKMKVGNLTWTQEPYAHYPWGFCYHTDQGRVLCGGFTSSPHEIVVYKTATEVPVEESESQVNGYNWASLAIKVIQKGGSIASAFDKPSMTCMMSREGWSLFKGCSSDEIAEMPFDDAEKWIRDGMIGSFRRDDLNAAEMYSLLVYFYRQSQRYLREGGALMASLKSWWIVKYGAVPAIPAGAIYTSEPNPYLRVVKGTGTEWVAVVVRDWHPTSEVPPPHVIVADEGMPNQVALPTTLAPGQHALKAKATMVGEVTVMVQT